MVTFDQFKLCVLVYKNQFDLWEQMRSRYPRTYMDLLIDDEYVEKLQANQEVFLKYLFGESVLDWIMWFFYDKPTGPSKVITSNGVEYMIDTIEDFLYYMEQEYFNEN